MNGFPARGQQTHKPRIRLGRILKKQWVMMLMLLPATAYALIFSYWPMSGIVMAFQSYTFRGGIYRSPWNGLANFRYLWISGKLTELTLNTMLYNLAFLLVGLVLEVGFAVILNELAGKRMKKVCQSLMFLPYFISWVVVGAIMFSLFNFEKGVMNYVLELLGVAPVDIYNNPQCWPVLLVLVRAWKVTGYGMVVYLATITSLDQEMFEAASIDGASVWQRIRYITIPSLVPTMMIMFLLGVGNIFRGDFGLFYQTVGSNSNLLSTTDIIDTYVFRSLMSNSDMGMTAAAGLYQSVLCFVTISIVNWIVKKIEPNYALF